MFPALDETLSEVFRLLAERAGMAADTLGDASVAHALRHRTAASGAASPQDYLRRLLRDPSEFQEFLEGLVVPETWIFRDSLAFLCLARHLDAVRSSGQRLIRALSIACSTGEEVYSLAIAFREAGLEPTEFFILGTDVSRRSLDLAAQGTLAPRSFREQNERTDAIRQRWCERVGESWKVCDELRGGVEFRWGNFAEPDFLADEPPFDVVFCRNVLIYFHAEARRMAVRHLQRLLGPGGLLCSAPAEARIFSEAGFRSLGSECPFAFHPTEPRADTARAAATIQRRPAVAQRFPDNGAVVTRVAPRPALIESPSSRRAVHAEPPSPVSGDGEVTSQDVLHAAKEAADNGRLDEANALCDQVLARNPASAEAHYLRGVIRHAQGLSSESQQSLERALYLDPKHYPALVHLMLISQQRGDSMAAANYRRRAEQAAAQEPQ